MLRPSLTGALGALVPPLASAAAPEAWRVTSRRVVVARGSARRAFKGRRLLHLRFTAAARAMLSTATALRMRLSAVARQGTTGTRSVKRTLALTR